MERARRSMEWVSTDGTDARGAPLFAFLLPIPGFLAPAAP